MSVAFRNLSLTSDAPVSEWGVEGMLTAIDRGGSREWRRISDEVRRDPDGDAAQDLEAALPLAEDAGVVSVMRRVLWRARASDQERSAARARRWVAESGLTRADIASLIGTSRSRLSTYETGHVVPSATTAAKLATLARRRQSHLVP